MLFNTVGEAPSLGIKQPSRKLFDALYERIGEKSTKYTPGKDDVWFRMSGIGYMCPRAYYLSEKHGAPMEQEVSNELNWIFGVGHAYHHRFQNYWLKTLGDIFQGWWRCTKCGEVHKGESIDPGVGLSHMWIPEPKSCNRCKAERDESDRDDDTFEYVEIEFRDESIKMTGHLDGILVWPDGETEAFDLKTISERGMTKVDPRLGGSPKEANVEQLAGCYGSILRKLGVKKGRLVYVMKGSETAKNSIWEHEVEFSDEHVDAAMAKVSACRSAIRDARESPDNEGLVPISLDDCSRKSSYRAKSCEMRDLCFPKKK